MPASYLTLEVRVLVLPELDTPFPVERPSLDGLKALLVLNTPKPMTIKVHIRLRGLIGALSSGVFPGPLGGELSRSHFLQGHIFKVILQEKPIYHN